MNTRIPIAIFSLASIAACGNPEPPNWDSKDAHRSCAVAIDAFPKSPAPPCAAMHMCANEAKLTVEQRGKLMEMIRATDGCRKP